MSRDEALIARLEKLVGCSCDFRERVKLNPFAQHVYSCRVNAPDAITIREAITALRARDELDRAVEAEGNRIAEALFSFPELGLSADDGDGCDSADPADGLRGAIGAALSRREDAAERPAPKILLERWNYSGQPSVESYNHAVDVANANAGRADRAERQLAERAAPAVPPADELNCENFDCRRCPRCRASSPLSPPPVSGEARGRCPTCAGVLEVHSIGRLCQGCGREWHYRELTARQLKLPSAPPGGLDALASEPHYRGSPLLQDGRYDTATAMVDADWYRRVLAALQQAQRIISKPSISGEPR